MAYNYTNDYLKNQLETIKNFYIKVKFNNFSNINKENINIIKAKASKNTFYINNKYNSYSNLHKYTRIVEMLVTNKKAFDLNSDDEKLLFLLFSIDPEFEMLKITLEENRINDIKYKSSIKFGFYDPRIVKLEKLYIKFLYNNEEKKEFDKEIEKRAFK